MIETYFICLYTFSHAWIEMEVWFSARWGMNEAESRPFSHRAGRMGSSLRGFFWSHGVQEFSCFFCHQPLPGPPAQPTLPTCVLWVVLAFLKQCHSFGCYIWLYLQGAKKIIFTACPSGKLKLAFTSPDVISTSPKNVLFFCYSNSS